MKTIILSEKWTGLCNQLFALTNGILETIQSQYTSASVGSFSPQLNSMAHIPITKVINLEQTGSNVGLQLTPTTNKGRCSFAWYNRYNETKFINILCNIKFQPIFYTIADELCDKHIDYSIPIHVLHLRIEQDCIQHWSQVNKIPQNTFQTKLCLQYYEALKHIPPGEQIIVLTYDTNNPFLQALQTKYKILTFEHKNIINERIGHSGRELCAIVDLLIGLKCTGTFIGCHNFELKRGSTFSYVLWKLMMSVKQGVFIDLDDINNNVKAYKKGPGVPTQPTARSARVSQPTTRSAIVSQPTARSVRVSQSTTRSVRVSQPTARSVRVSQPTVRSVRQTQPTARSVRPTQSTVRSVRSTQPTVRSVRSTQPTAPPINTFAPQLVKINDMEQSQSISDRKNYIYFHICTLGPWKIVVNRLYQKIINSGLIDIVEKINVVVLGNAVDQVKKLLAHPKVNIIYTSRNTGIYERKCLSLLQDHANKEDCRFMYIHSKGITKRDIGINDWIELLIYFNIEQHQQCIKGLEQFDTVGVNINTAPKNILRNATVKDPNKSYHYSGNFWWANSDYVRTLSKTIGPKYLDPELWIGGGNKKTMLSLWQSGINHYNHRYPRSIYEGKINRTIHTINCK